MASLRSECRLLKLVPSQINPRLQQRLATAPTVETIDKFLSYHFMYMREIFLCTLWGRGESGDCESPSASTIEQ